MEGHRNHVEALLRDAASEHANLIARVPPEATLAIASELDRRRP